MVNATSKIEDLFITELLEYMEDNYTYIAIGEGDTAPTGSDLTLETEYERGLCVISITDAEIEFSKEFEGTEDIEINEAGLFNTDVDGTMAIRAVADTAINLSDGLFLNVVITLELVEGVV